MKMHIISAFYSLNKRDKNPFLLWQGINEAVETKSKLKMFMIFFFEQFINGNFNLFHFRGSMTLSLISVLKLISGDVLVCS